MFPRELVRCSGESRGTYRKIWRMSSREASPRVSLAEETDRLNFVSTYAEMNSALFGKELMNTCMTGPA